MSTFILNKYSVQNNDTENLTPNSLDDVSWNIADRYTYIDTIKVWFARVPTDAEFNTLYRLRGGAVISLKGTMAHRAQRARPGQMFGPNIFQWKRGFVFHQPGDRLLAYIAEAFGADEVLVNAVHFALDLVFNDAIALDNAAEFYRLHRNERLTANTAIRPAGNMLYTRTGGSRNRLVDYADKHCRTTGEVHCLHIERRLEGAAVVAGVGVTTLADLLAYNHHNLWDGTLDMRAIDLRELGRVVRQQIDRRAGRKPRRGYHRTDILRGHLVCREAMRGLDDALPGYAVMPVKDYVKRRWGCSVAVALERVPHTALLPLQAGKVPPAKLRPSNPQETSPKPKLDSKTTGSKLGSIAADGKTAIRHPAASGQPCTYLAPVRYFKPVSNADLQEVLRLLGSQDASFACFLESG